MVGFIKKYLFQIAFIALILLAIFLRFYHYENRWGLAYDQSHDALLSIYAVENYKLPFLGPFSSAGPFQTGGEWYWIVMIGTILLPHTLMGPWIFMTFLYVLFVFLIFYIGSQIKGQKFGLLVGFLAAVSTAQIAQGTNLTNQSPLALISLLGIWCSFLYLARHNLRYLFYLGLCIGVGSSIHLSGIALIFLAVSLFIVQKKFSFKGIALLLLGILIPWLPVLFVDLQHNLVNTRNMVNYYLHDQYNIPLEALGRRWLTYLGVFWPKQWAYIIGGPSLVGYLLMTLLSLPFIVKDKKKKEMVVILLSVLFMIILLRYTHTPIYESYLVFIHPFILFLSAWVIYICIQKNNVIGLLLLAIVLAGTFYNDYKMIKGSTNYSAIFIGDITRTLYEKYPDRKFAVYVYNDKWKDFNYSLSLYLEKEKKADKNGLKISTVLSTQELDFSAPAIYGNKGGYQVIDIHASSSAILSKQGWRLVDGETVYIDTEDWYDRK